MSVLHLTQFYCHLYCSFDKIMLHCVKSVNVQIQSFFWSVFSCQNTGKHGPEKTPYLETFYAVMICKYVNEWIVSKYVKYVSMLIYKYEAFFRAWRISFINKKRNQKNSWNLQFRNALCCIYVLCTLLRQEDLLINSAKCLFEDQLE